LDHILGTCVVLVAHLQSFIVQPFCLCVSWKCHFIGQLCGGENGSEMSRYG